MRAQFVVAVLLLAGCELAPLGPPVPTEGAGGGDEGCGGVVHPHLQSDAVVAPSKAPVPISGGTMAILSDGTVVAADSDRDLLHFYSAARGAWEVQLPQGSEPGRVVEALNGQVFVALRARSQVAAVDPATGEQTLQHVCASPRGLAFDDSANQLFVACATGELARVTFGERVWTTTLSRPAPDLRDLMLKDGHLWASSFRSAQLWDIDLATMKATALPGPQTLQLAQTHLAPQVAWRSVLVNGNVMMIHQGEQIEPVAAAGSCSASYGASDDGISAPTLATLLTTLDGTNALTLQLPGVLPVDLASNGALQAIAEPGSNQVIVIDGPNTWPATVEGQPVSVAFAADGRLWVFTRQPAQFIVLDHFAQTQRILKLAGDSVFSTGHDLFHQGTFNSISCASCHPEAGDDGHVWALPEGTVKTPALRGGLKGTEPFHWSGEEKDMPALLDDIFVSRMNGAPQTSQRTAALLDWLDGLPSRAAPTDLDPSAVARGAQQFEASGCGSCHSGRLGTNNTTVDVGTGGAFQVPRLVELAYHAPFMHDGRAQTLADRFTPLGGSAHGNTDALSPGKISDLVAYLQSR
jgi:hypothetical protein